MASSNNSAHGGRIGMPVIRECEHCHRKLPNSTTVCPCRSSAVEQPRVPRKPRTPRGPNVDTPGGRIGMPRIHKCEHCGRTLPNSLTVCQCRNRDGIRPTSTGESC